MPVGEVSHLTLNKCRAPKGVVFKLAESNREVGPYGNREIHFV